MVFNTMQAFYYKRLQLGLLSFLNFKVFKSYRET
jgi:hypothetical protein